MTIQTDYKKVLITGASGFVGHHVCESILKNTDWDIVTLDRLSEITNHGFDRLRDIQAFDDCRVTRFTYDLNNLIGRGLIEEIGEIDYILHIASSSHVDDSIVNPVDFIRNNINLQLTILEYARTKKSLKRFIAFSTDEVYGTAPSGIDYSEGDRFNPGNPYSASKAAQEAICYAYANTYSLPVVITNTMNVIGERQHPQKFLPKTINCVLKGEILPIHSNRAKTKAGQRYYIHARNVADALLFILNNTEETLDNVDASLGKFHIVGEKEFDNLELAQLIAKFVGKPLNYEMVDFHSARPGHDLRYALSGEKLEKLGWKPPVDIEASIGKTVQWFLEHNNWL